MTQLTNSAAKSLNKLNALIETYANTITTNPRKAFSAARAFLVHGSRAILKDVKLSDVFEGFVSTEVRKTEKPGVAKEYAAFKTVYNTTGGHRNQFCSMLKLKHADPAKAWITFEQILKIWSDNNYERMNYFQFLEALSKL